MDRNFHELHDRTAAVLPTERSTGVVFAVVCAAVGAFYFRDTRVLTIALGLSAAFLLLSFLLPRALRPLNLAWFKFGRLLHRITNPVVMGLLFVAVILPFGLAMQLRQDPLRKKRNAGTSSYWIGHKTAEHGVPSMRNQF